MLYVTINRLHHAVLTCRPFVSQGFFIFFFHILRNEGFLKVMRNWCMKPIKALTSTSNSSKTLHTNVKVYSETPLKGHL